MKIKMNRTLTVPEEFANLLSQLGDIFQGNEEDFINAVFAICIHDYEFEVKDGYADIIYEKGE